MKSRLSFRSTRMRVRVFVSEFVSGGAWPELRLADSLLREGKAMLAAISDDMSRVPECKVVTTHDARIEPFASETVESICVSSPDEERQTFTRLAAQCDKTLVIAPEFESILANRCRLVAEVGGRILGPSLEAVKLCSNKLQLATRLQSLGIPIIATAEFDIHQGKCDVEFPVVLKPRDGAGSLRTFLLANQHQLEKACRVLQEESPADDFIVQPYIEGTAMSVAVVRSIDQSRFDLFPPGEQLLSQDGRFSYLGGTIPTPFDVSPAFEQRIRRVVESIHGLEGYVGIDFIVPEDRIEEAIIVEINPRLTTSYLGYRRLANNNLAERILFPQRTFDDVDWKNETITFGPESE